jgi:hypothetical protein
VMTVMSGSTPMASNISSTWTLQNCTCHDLGGTSASAVSTTPALPGTAAAAPFSANTAVVISWQWAPAIRGGRPRTYIPGIPQNAILTTGSSQLSSAYAGSMYAAAAAFLTSVNAHTPPGGASHMTLGAVSYYHGHAVRPTPVFNPFLSARVHERLDSQRRRLGKEATYPIVP